MTLIDPKLRQALTGISGILVTPFDDRDEVAPDRLSAIIDRAIGAGVHILVSNGNTGEFYGLTTAEAERMIHGTAELVGGRVPLLGGVGRSIKEACSLARPSPWPPSSVLAERTRRAPPACQRPFSTGCTIIRRNYAQLGRFLLW